MSIHDILAEFRDAALNNRDLGDKFERLIRRYLELDPQYSERFSNVWLWNEWPRKGEVGDIGIDLVAEEEATGDIVGVQCKFAEYRKAYGDDVSKRYAPALMAHLNRWADIPLPCTEEPSAERTA